MFFYLFFCAVDRREFRVISLNSNIDLQVYLRYNASITDQVVDILGG